MQDTNKRASPCYRPSAYSSSASSTILLSRFSTCLPRALFLHRNLQWTWSDLHSPSDTVFPLSTQNRSSGFDISLSHAPITLSASGAKSILFTLELVEGRLYKT